MGARHFKQMYEDAFTADRRAIVYVMLMRMTTAAEAHSQLGNLWLGVPKDKLMALARNIQQLDDQFTDRLKLMLLDGEIHIFIPDRYGKVHKIRDPDVIDFDDPILSEERFLDVVDIFLADENCSGLQN